MPCEFLDHVEPEYLAFTRVVKDMQANQARVKILVFH
jgi:hypothetical protein